MFYHLLQVCVFKNVQRVIMLRAFHQVEINVNYVPQNVKHAQIQCSVQVVRVTISIGMESVLETVPLGLIVMQTNIIADNVSQIVFLAMFMDVLNVIIKLLFIKGNVWISVNQELSNQLHMTMN